MTDRCEKCYREKGDIHSADHYTDGRDRCWRENALSCQVTGAYRRGLREGVEIAKAHAFGVPATRDNDWGTVDWSDVDAELERRLK